MDARPSRNEPVACEACELARQQSLARARFVARLGHTLRTPLNGIQGFSQILLQEAAGPLNDRQRRQLERIEEAGLRLLSLVDSLAELSRIQAGEAVPHPEAADLASVVSRALEGHRAEAQAKGVSIAVGLEEDLPAVETDADMMTDVLSRLVGNAIRHGPDGGRVDVATSLTEERPDVPRSLRITVTDQGQGIPAQELGRLTSDAEPPRDPAAGSKRSGLGLVVAQRLVDLLGGRLRIMSDPGQGTVVEVRLPIRFASPMGQETTRGPATASSSPRDALAAAARE